MGATCFKSAYPESAPPPYEAPGYKPSHYEPSHYGPSHYAPPSYTIQCSVTHAVPAATTRQSSTRRKVSNSFQQKVSRPTQQKVANSVQRRAVNSTQQRVVNSTQQRVVNSTQQRVVNSTQQRVVNKAVTSDSVECEVMILGLPKADGLTPHVLAKLVASALGTSIVDGDIIDVYRIPGNGRRTQPLVIKFSSIELCDKWISLKKKKKGLLAHQVHPVFGNEKVSVVERLTPENQALFEKVQRFSRQNNYQFVWTTHGNIFIRKIAGADGHLIQCDGDLNNLRN